MEKKFYKTSAFKSGAFILIGILLYKIVTGIFFK